MAYCLLDLQYESVDCKTNIAHLWQLSFMKMWNCLLSKLAGPTSGSSASTHRTSALALWSSVAEYCCPIWTRSCYTKLVYSQLNNSMRLMSGTLQPTQLSSCLPLLANIAPLELRCKAASDAFLNKVVLVCPELPVHTDIFDHPPQRLMSVCPMWTDTASSNIKDAWCDSWLQWSTSHL